jgi:poly(ribitol-phosphate) beta-N-acetylglucosaminyltransferase
MNINFSIIIPTYNAATSIENALNSIVKQSCRQGIEIIVVDDASQDNTVAKVTAYQASQVLPENITIKIVANQQNAGPGVARNSGILQAEGEWILFLDADDSLHLDALTQLQNVATQSPEAEILAFDWAYADLNGTLPSSGVREEFVNVDFSNHDEVIKQYLLNRIDSSVIFHAFKRSLLETHQILFRGGYHEDVDYLFETLLHSQNITLLPQVLYYKWNRPGSIVNTLGTNHINGYFDAIENIYALLSKAQLQQKMLNPYMQGVINITASRLMRLINPSIQKTAAIEDLLQLLLQRIQRICLRMSCNIGDFTEIKDSIQTKYQMIFSLFARYIDYTDSGNLDAFITELNDIKDKSWSCYDLHHSVFLAPGEIRTCCKRFYYKGKFKGDVAIMKFHDKPFSELPYQQIVQEKNNLHKEINRDNAEDCKGCPFLSFEKWGKPLQKGIQYLSLEYQTVCNMRCTYCSDVYYGGKPAAYVPYEIVQSMVDSQALNHCEYVVWGGGEPTLDKSFTEVMQLIGQGVPHVKQRVITNATRFNPDLAELMRLDRAFIVTSIDAGTEETFKAIRQYNNFKAVLRNLKRYAEIAAHNVIIKYILMPENLAIEELDAFCQLIQSYGLETCNFQISCDFRSPSLDMDQAYALSLLYAKLSAINVNFVFMDDLVWQRLSNLNQDTIALIREKLSSLDLDDVYESPDDYQHIAVWGTGAQAKLLMEKTSFLKNSSIEYFIDPRAGKAGTMFYDLPVKSSDSLLTDNQPILIAAVQSAPFIYQDIQKLGINQHRVIKGLIL